MHTRQPRAWAEWALDISTSSKWADEVSRCSHSQGLGDTRSVVLIVPHGHRHGRWGIALSGPIPRGSEHSDHPHGDEAKSGYTPLAHALKILLGRKNRVRRTRATIIAATFVCIYHAQVVFGGLTPLALHPLTGGGGRSSDREPGLRSQSVSYWTCRRAAVWGKFPVSASVPTSVQWGDGVVPVP